MLPERAFGRSLTSIMFFHLFYADPDRDSTGPRSHVPPWSTAELAEFRRQFRQRLVKIGNESIVGDLEDRRLFVLVDGHAPPSTPRGRRYVGSRLKPRPQCRVRAPHPSRPPPPASRWGHTRRRPPHAKRRPLHPACRRPARYIWRSSPGFACPAR